MVKLLTCAQMQITLRTILAGPLFLAVSTPAFPDDISINFSWDGVPPCQTLSKKPPNAY
jgi:hypothetical protein